MVVDYTGYKKADLTRVAQLLDIHTVTKDTKKILTDKLDNYILSHPQDGEATVQQLLELPPPVTEEISLPTANPQIDADATTSDSDDDHLPPPVAREEVEEEEEEVEVEVEVEEEDDEEDDDEDDDNVEGEEKDIDDDEDDENDEDYTPGPPVDLKEWIVDPLVEFGESTYQKFYQFTDRVGITTLPEKARGTLSQVVTLNYLLVLMELAYFTAAHIRFVPIYKNNLFVKSYLVTLIPYLRTVSIPFPDLTVLGDYTVYSTLLSWIGVTVVLPLFISYFVNFSSRLVIINDDESNLSSFRYDYDPFTFNLVRLVIIYFIKDLTLELTADYVYQGLVSHVKHSWTSYLFNLNVFIHELGTYPTILGLANVLLGIYAQFEEL